MSNNGKNPFEEFINSLPNLNNLGEKPDADAELVDLLLRDWFRMFGQGVPIEQDKRDFTVEVFKEMKNTVIYEDWARYILAMLDWFRASAVDYRSALLGSFLFGYCWNGINYEEEDE
jgi:hypothetical protein